jgi:hypothetical protein
MDELENILKDRILSSSKHGSWTPDDPVGSFYKTILLKIQEYLDQNGDWIILRNCLTEENFWASSFEPFAKK